MKVNLLKSDQLYFKKYSAVREHAEYFDGARTPSVTLSARAQSSSHAAPALLTRRLSLQTGGGFSAF
jgi:hypothetical protein